MKKQDRSGRDKGQLVSTRVPPEMFQQIEQFMAHLNAERPGLDVDRAGAVRVLLTMGLAAHAQGKKP